MEQPPCVALCIMVCNGGDCGVGGGTAPTAPPHVPVGQTSTTPMRGAQPGPHAAYGGPNGDVHTWWAGGGGGWVRGRKKGEGKDCLDGKCMLMCESQSEALFVVTVTAVWMDA